MTVREMVEALNKCMGRGYSWVDDHRLRLSMRKHEVKNALKKNNVRMMRIPFTEVNTLVDENTGKLVAILSKDGDVIHWVDQQMALYVEPAGGVDNTVE